MDIDPDPAKHLGTCVTNHASSRRDGMTHVLAVTPRPQCLAGRELFLALPCTTWGHLARESRCWVQRKGPRLEKPPRS